MEIKKVTDASFRKYGRVLTGIDFTELLAKMQETPCPADVIYEPSVAELEALPVYKELQTVSYGELPIQVGYCNGNNYKLNAVEYHRSSELDIAASDAVLLLGWQPDVTDDITSDPAKIEACLRPKGPGVELYAPTLQKDTNLPLGEKHEGGEDGHLTAKNKWLIGHPEGGLPEGSPLGLIGENISLK